jgi:3-hydroxybutyryl-CoA dehydrogenase
MSHDPASIRRVLVLGTGTMGQGIAQVTALAGYVTHLYDIDAGRIDKAIDAIKHVTDRLVQKGKMLNEARSEMIGMLVPTPELSRGAEGVDLVIEAAPEKMDLKVDVLGRAKLGAPPTRILASNTSSLSITELGQRLGAGGAHGRPPLLQPAAGDGAARDRARPRHERRHDRHLPRLRQAHRQDADHRADTPGFATSRLGVAIGAEAMRMLESGVASVADIDRAMELGYRHPMGPLKLSDLVGLDVRLAILEHLHREVGEQFRPPTILRRWCAPAASARRAARASTAGPIRAPSPPETPALTCERSGSRAAPRSARELSG